MDSFIPQGDSSIALLDGDALNDIKPAESCCFLRQVMVFYLRSVFGHYTSKHPIVRRRCSSLANSFSSIEKPLTECVLTLITAMKFSGSFLYLVALALLVHGVPAAMGRRLHFGKCVVSVQVHELREYFSEIRKTIVGEDGNSGVRLLKEHAMMNIKHAHLHCQCDEETKKRIEAIQSTFEKRWAGAGCIRDQPVAAVSESRVPCCCRFRMPEKALPPDRLGSFANPEGRVLAPCSCLGDRAACFVIPLSELLV
ncbi:UNVERIFIED_CONTAM: hypothetical protein FKN15_000397 [Acipenser sinensis]